MASIKHFAAPAGMTTPPLSFATRTGDLLFVSGIPGFDENGKLPDGFEAQFGFVVRNIKRVLDEAGATFRDLVKVNVLLTRASDVAGVYGAAGAGLAVGRGARAIVLSNQKGAVLELTGQQVGLMANADLSGLAITLK